EKKIEGISDIQDYSDRTGMRIWIQVKRDAAAQVVLNTLYKMSDLQVTFGVNMIAIVHGRPQLLSLRDCLAHFIDHRRTVVTRRSRFELNKALERREIVEGLGVAIDAIDRIIALIRASKDPDEARIALCAEPLTGFAGFLERTGRPQAEIEAARAKPYRLNQRQAKAILDMRLQRLTGLERDKIEGEYRELCATISYLESILSDPALLMKVIRDELSAIGSEYGDARRTAVVEDEGEIEPIDLVADEPMIVMLTNNGYIKRLPSHEYRVQGRGGVGVKGGVGRDTTDFVTELFEANAHSHVLLFTNTGRMFHTRVFELPQGRRESAGKALVNFLDLREGERVLGMVPYRDEDVDDGEHYIVMISAQGYIKRTKLDEFSNIRSTGIIAATIEEDDQLIDARLTNGKRHIMLTSARGMAIRFEEGDVRPMGRTARGVRGMDLRTGDQVVGMTVLDADTDAAILTMCAQGYGKRTAAEDYKVQNRGGKGIITIKVSNRNGPVVGSLAVQTDDQIMLVTSKGKVIRTRVAEISTVGRNTQGVRVIRTGEDERVVAIERLVDQDDASVEESAVPVEAAPEEEPEGDDGDE
ncbi:MAG: DNA gyrase subunit A, partial [Myxococcales bacterium]|nr:DNA gyrase subunit A [Myxococcales bacterium]